ncbi:protein kinase domain-containing protein [Nocardia sp. NBC_00511]|uniref:serine/threonine-protein kinase n=1 Tax=Nocardia sp. NBC_00511 TaxID=2903591 RepID=UPI0030E0F802
MAAGARAGSRFGQYELRRLLGVGGMGEVYEAYDTVRDRVVAVKLLDVDLARQPNYVERFRRESRTAAKLQEPHVIPVHDWGEVDGVLFIDMRMVRGRDLKAYLSQEGPLPPEQAVAVIEQVASALDAAHESGLVHRDIKPANILLTGDMFAYLVDFGIAHAESDAQLTGTGNAIGSFAYMAPERFEHNATVSPSADIYALACVLYECLTGRPPFHTDGNGNLATIRAHMLTPPPHPSTRPGVPATFDQVVAIGMAKEQGRRYTSAGQLARASRAALLRAATGDLTRTTVPPAPTGPRPLPPNPTGGVSGPQRVEYPSGPVDYPGTGQPAGPVDFPRGHPSAPVSYPTPGQNDPTLLRNIAAGQSNYQPGYTDPIGPREHPSAPLPLPPKERNPLPVLVGALLGVVLLLAVGLGWVLLRGSDSGNSEANTSPSGGPVSTTGRSSTSVVTTTLAPLSGAVSGTDAQGYVDTVPRCDADDPAMAIGRTSASRLVVCRTATGRFYYKGIRVSDGAGIQIDDPSPDGNGGFSVTNPTDGTQYRITAYSLVITNGGNVAANESMIEYAHR